jgi:hypothetical protein
LALTSTESTPKSLAKKPGAFRSTRTLTVSLATFLLANVTVAVPPPFLSR